MWIRKSGTRFEEGEAVYEGPHVERHLFEGKYKLDHKHKKGQKTMKLEHKRRNVLKNRLAGL